jgi:hypothetical protein
VCYVAQQTKKISLQGFLKDANGKAVPDGNQDITFKLYTSETGGTAAWTDIQTINVYGGVYSAYLGSPTNPIDGLNWGNTTYFVGVTVQGVELTPRTELTFAPYSLGSPKADVANTVICSGAVGDVKYSILNPTQFALQNGNCWVPMDGRALLVSDKLRTIIPTMANIPDAGGLFLRGQEFSTSPDNDPDRTSTTAIASFQDQAMERHKHPFSGATDKAGIHNHSYTDNVLSYRSSNFTAPAGGGEGNDAQNRNTSNAGEHTHTFSGNTDNNTGNSAAETRPKNLNLWIYIRIN